MARTHAQAKLVLGFVYQNGAVRLFLVLGKIVPVAKGIELQSPRNNLGGALGVAQSALHEGSPILLLTRAERYVAELVSLGASNPEIACTLGLSRHTVESHLKHTFVKLGLTSRVQLAVLVARSVHPAGRG